MVRKVTLIALAVTFSAICAMSASAYTIYDEGNISSSYVTIFEDIAHKLLPNDDYVVFRSGQYNYTMVVGDLSIDSNVITSADAVKVYNISTSQSGYTSSVYNFSVSFDDSFSLNLGNYLVYSNLGDYPSLNERSDFYAFCSLLLLSVFVLCYLLSSVFSFSLRFRH